MDRDFDKYLEELSQPLPDAPEPQMAPLPESVPMEKTVLVDLAGEVEGKKSVLNAEADARSARKAEGMDAPVDVYEPGFRTDLRDAILSYWRDQRKIRENNQKIREKTGIGRYRTWTP